MNDESQGFLEKAERALKAAELLWHEGYPADTASKSYYAMFYSAQAALRAEGIEVIKHSAVESFFGQHFVKTGRVDAKYHRLLIRARKLRETADYNVEEDVSEADARQALENGKAFVDTIKAILAT